MAEKSILPYSLLFNLSIKVINEPLEKDFLSRPWVSIISETTLVAFKIVASPRCLFLRSSFLNSPKSESVLSLKWEICAASSSLFKSVAALKISLEMSQDLSSSAFSKAKATNTFVMAWSTPVLSMSLSTASLSNAVGSRTTSKLLGKERSFAKVRIRRWLNLSIVSTLNPA